MGDMLLDKTVVVVGRGSGIARAITLLARSEGARVVVAGRDKEKLAAAYDEPGITAEIVDVANAVLFAMTNTFLTGVTLKIDGGEPLT